MTALLRKMRPKSSSSGKTSSCSGRKTPARVDEVDERQAVLQGDALGAQHLLGGHREERAGLDRGVVGDDHDPPARDRADAGDDARRRGPAPLGVHAPRGPQAQLEELRAGIEEAGDALAGGEAALGVLALDGLGAAAVADGFFLALEVGDVGGEVVHALLLPLPLMGRGFG